MNPERLQYDLFRFLAPLAAFFLLCLLVSTFRHEAKRHVAVIYIAYLVGTIGYLLTNTMEICSRSEAESFLWSRLMYFFVCSLPILWLEFCYRFTHAGRGMSPGLITALAMVPLATLAFVFSDRLSAHMWSGFTWIRQGEYYVSIREHGLWFYIYAAYTYSVFLTGAAMVILAFLRYRHYYRRQAYFVATAIAIPLCMSVVFVFRPIPGLVKDYTPLAYAVSCLLFYPALFKRELFSLQPVARNLVVERLRDAILILDEGSRLVDANPAALELLGLGKESIGFTLLDRGSQVAISRDGEPAEDEGKAGGEVLAAVREAISMHGRREFFILKDGEERWYSAEVLPIGENTGNSLVTIRDETELKLLLRRIGELANTDELTGLPNRRSFMRDGAREVSRAERHGESLAVAMFDLDGFKRLNDTYGHAMGDTALHEFGAILLSEVRGEDVVGRIGGEEFALVLSGATVEGARTFCERIRSRLEFERFYNSKGEAVEVTVSTGIVILGAERLDLEALLSRADTALYRAKDKGKNRVEIYEEEGR